MANEFQQASLFELSGDDIRITYSSSSFAGSPLFSYRDSSINRQFRGGKKSAPLKQRLASYLQ